jgi:flagellar biogenesis protein FliO
MTRNVELRSKCERSSRLKLALQLFSIAAVVLFCAAFAGAEEAPRALPTAALPDVSFSLLRLLGALVLVIALFLGGVWLYRNWQRLAVYKGRSPRLNVLEVKSLGGRHALYLIGYDEQRFLIASSPTGINLLTHLPEAAAAQSEAPAPEPAAERNFAQRLRQAVFAKP